MHYWRCEFEVFLPELVMDDNFSKYVKYQYFIFFCLLMSEGEVVTWKCFDKCDENVWLIVSQQTEFFRRSMKL